MTSRVRVNSENGGQVVFARLGWPGYRATLNGHDISFKVVAKSLSPWMFRPERRTVTWC